VKLVTVIAILGILSALLLPAIAQGKKTAQRLQCAGNLREMGLGLHGFVADNHVYPLFHPWFHAVGEGLGSSKPADSTKGLWRCPSAQWHYNSLPAGWFPSCYGYNGYGLIAPSLPDTIGLGGDNHSGFLAPPTRESEVLQPSDMMAIGDGFGSSILFDRENLNHVEMIGNASSRHTGKGNVLFCDSHVELPPLKLLFDDTTEEALRRWNRDHEQHRERLDP
jgi:prepilin-type processing-associated H-X9-DG protein